MADFCEDDINVIIRYAKVWQNSIKWDITAGPIPQPSFQACYCNYT